MRITAHWKILLCGALIYNSGSFLQAQKPLQTEHQQTAEHYVRKVLLGEGIYVANITHVGMVGGLGSFQADSTLLGLSQGLVLSTGHVDSIHGPNDRRNYTSYGSLPASISSKSKIAAGDRDLNKLCSGKTKDITVLQFNFVPTHNVLEFRYVFASEEYKEFVNSIYNDVFGFFIRGPGIKKKMNIALLPDGKTPVAINTINHKKFKNQYIDNSWWASIGLKKIFVNRRTRKFHKALSAYIQFDGLTTVLTVKCDVIPFAKYQIKIAIGDDGDNAYDSAVFIEGGSFSSVRDTNGGFFHFEEKYALNPPSIDSLLNVYAQQQTEEEVLEEKHEAIPPIEFEFTEIYFGVNSDEIPDTSLASLDSLVEIMLTYPELEANLSGYTDNSGSKAYNQSLSEQRAKQVKEYLISKGISSNRITITGYNFERPRNGNSSETERAQNRRVEIFLYCETCN